MRGFRTRVLGRLAAGLLCGTALPLLANTALAATFNVGGGTINTAQADNSTDNTGTGGGFSLQANTVSTGDVISVASVVINNPTGRALDIGGSLPSAGSYSVTMHGSTLTGGGGGWFQSSGGLLSLDTTGGAANTMSGDIALTVSNGSGNGAIALKLGADTVTSTTEAIQAIGSNTVTIDLAGTTVTSSGTYGMVAQSGLGVTIGGLNGGISGSITANSGYGIYSSSNGDISVTIAAAGNVTALNALYLQGFGSTVTVNNFGTINGANNALDSSFSTRLNVTLQSGSTTSGILLGGSGSDTFTVFGGAHIGGATFNGGAWTDSLTLTGSGNGSFAVTKASNVESFEKSGSGTWTLTGTTTFSTPWTVSGGTLSISDDASLGSSTGALTLNGATLQATASVESNRSVMLGASGGILWADTNVAIGQHSIVSGSGGLTVAGPGGVVLTASNTYTGGTTILNNATLTLGGGGTTTGSVTGSIANNGALIFNRRDVFVVDNAISGTGMVSVFGAPATVIFTNQNTYTGGTYIDSNTSLQIGNGGTTGSVAGNIIDHGALIFDRADSTTFAGAISGAGAVIKRGGGTLILTGVSTYSGTTIISAGALQLGAGGTTGSVSGDVVNNGTLIFNRSSSQFSGVISGSGSVINNGSGLTLTANNTYSGDTVINGGTLNIGDGGTTGAVSGNIVNNGGLVFNRSDTVIFAGNISGTGGLGKIAPGSGTLILTGDNSYTGTTQFLGTLQIGNGGTTGSIAGNVLNRGTLIFNRSDDVSFGGGLGGPGHMIKRGAGTLTLTGFSTGTGNLDVEAGTLRLGSSSAVGFGSINTTNSAIEYLDDINVRNAISLGGTSTRFQVAGGAAATQSGSISGNAGLEKTDQGALTLTAANSYSGATTVGAGTLSVTGALSNSNTNVASGGTLTGTGSVRNVIVAGGGTVGPAGTGTLTVQGNLALNAGAAYADSITPSTAGLTNVSGTAGLNGIATISAVTGAYIVGQRYTLLTATGGLSGSFSTLSISNLPGYVKGRLGYDANNAYLYLDANAITPLLPSGASPNQASLAAGIDAGLQQGTVLNSGFTALFSLQGAALGNALNQVAGQGAPSIATAGGQSLTPFLSVMQGQGAFGGNGTDTAANFAPGNVYGAADAPRRAQLAPGTMRVWGSVYGGHTGISANAATGAAGLSANNVGFIAGAEVSLTDGLRLGGSAGFGSQDFSSANSVGDSDDVMLGLYARQDILESGYIAAAFAYSWHDIATTRTITVAGTDVLGAKFDAHAIGGRIEGGWRLALDEAFGVTPFFAFAGDNFYAPAYAESVISGTSNFALSYAANKTGQKHTEFGAHLDRAIDLGGGDMLSADARAAWAHQLDDAPFATATFQGLPGSTFRLLGVRAATDTALLGVGLKIRNPSGLDVGLRMDSQLGAGTTALQGMGTVSWRW